MKEVVLFSGGPDALIAWEFLKRPDALYVQHNCRYEYKQIKSVLKIKFKAKTSKINLSPTVIDLSEFEQPDANLPLRNMYLCMYAANMGYDVIHIALQKGEQSIPDRTDVFCKKLSDELTCLLEKTIKINPVFTDMTKQDMVKWYVNNGKDIEILKSTVSCFSPIFRMCGMCKACFRRWIAFEYNDISEEYAHDLTEWEGTYEYIRKIRNGDYDVDRSEQTIEVLRSFDLV